jgi:hypothetical protein
MITTRVLAPAGVALAAVLLSTAGPAVAKDGDVVTRGSCSGAATWKMKAGPEDGRIEVEAEIDSNRNGQTWRWVLSHNGSVAARGSSTTRAPSGSFEVRRVLADLAGTDTFAFTAQRPGTSQICRAVVRF